MEIFRTRSRRDLLKLVVPTLEAGLVTFLTACNRSRPPTPVTAPIATPVSTATSVPIARPVVPIPPTRVEVSPVVPQTATAREQSCPPLPDKEMLPTSSITSFRFGVIYNAAIGGIPGLSISRRLMDQYCQDPRIGINMLPGMGIMACLINDRTRTSGENIITEDFLTHMGDRYRSQYCISPSESDPLIVHGFEMRVDQLPSLLPSNLTITLERQLGVKLSVGWVLLMKREVDILRNPNLNQSTFLTQEVVNLIAGNPELPIIVAPSLIPQRLPTVNT